MRYASVGVHIPRMGTHSTPAQVRGYYVPTHAGTPDRFGGTPEMGLHIRGYLQVNIIFLRGNVSLASTVCPPE